MKSGIGGVVSRSGGVILLMASSSRLFAFKSGGLLNVLGLGLSQRLRLAGRLPDLALLKDLAGRGCPLYGDATMLVP